MKKFFNNENSFKSFYKKNKLVIATILLIVILGFFFSNLNKSSSGEVDRVYGDDVIELHFFYWTKCHFCKEQEKFHKYLVVKYPNLKIIKHEITDPQTKTIYEKMAKTLSGLPNSWADFPGTPVTIIGEKFTKGYGGDDTTGKQLVQIIEEEQKKIDNNWNSSTMKKSIELQNQVIKTN